MVVWWCWGGGWRLPRAYALSPLRKESGKTSNGAQAGVAARKGAAQGRSPFGRLLLRAKSIHMVMMQQTMVIMHANRAGRGGRGRAGGKGCAAHTCF